MIQLSPSAATEIVRLQACQAQPTNGFRLSVTARGCAGLSYDMQFTSAQPGDRLYTSNNVAIWVDPQSLSYLDGLTLDYSEDLMGGGFRFHNPQAQKSCSCGISFSLTN